MTIRSVDNLALWAADNATGNASGCMTSKEAFVACIWYVSSAGVKEGFAPLPNDNQCSDLYDHYQVTDDMIAPSLWVAQMTTK